MISPEQLRQYTFLGFCTEEQLELISMFADEISADKDAILFDECASADNLYFLLDGNVELSFSSEDKIHPTMKKIFIAGEINPGEVFGISAVIAPYVYSATGRTTKLSRFIRIEASPLRKLLEDDPKLGYLFMIQIAKALMERLVYTRVQLAAAWA